VRARYQVLWLLKAQEPASSTASEVPRDKRFIFIAYISETVKPQDLFKGANMPQPILDRLELKQLLKESLAETFIEQRELLHDVFEEVLEDISMISAIREGQQSERVERREIFSILAGNP
jgi:hypothetical protein